MFAALAILGQTLPNITKSARSSVPQHGLQTFRNVGRAYYEQGKYPEAIEQFQKLVTSGKAQATDHLNLGLALMGANKLDLALGEMTTAQQMDPQLVAAEYNLGILYKREWRNPDAEAALRRVSTADPQDPATWFNLGTVYCAEKKLDECLDAYHHVIAMGFSGGQNFYVASLFRTFTALVRLKRQEEAQKVLKHWETVRDRVPNISLQDPALEGGKYGVIQAPQAAPTEAAHRADLGRVTFAEVTQKLGLDLAVAAIPAFDAHKPIKATDYSRDFARQNLLPLFGPSIAVGDYDNDGHPDLYMVMPAGMNHLFHNNGDGTFTDVTANAGVAGTGGSLSATFGDFDNSGKMSLFVAGLDGVKVYQYGGDGAFQDITEKVGLKSIPGEVDTRAVLFDADNDGFLDMVVTAYTHLNEPPGKEAFVFPNDFSGSATHFLRNNGNGTFTDASASAGLDSAQGRMRGAVFADFSNHGYNDLFLFRDDGPPLFYKNLGEDKFALQPGVGPVLDKTVVLEAQVADFDHDGYFDLAVWSASGGQVMLNQRNGKFAAPAGMPALSSPTGPWAFFGTVVDVNGDGYADLLSADAAGTIHCLMNSPGRWRDSPIALPAGGPAPLIRLIPAWLENPGQLSLLGVTREGRLRVFEKQGPPAHWVEVKMTGMKSNTQGIGSIVEFKAGNYYNKVVVTSSPLRVFTGDLGKLDVIRVTWPNAVVQNWIDVATDKAVEVRESERLASSCPFLYLWNGRKLVYVTDVLGASPLGELNPDGTRTKPFPEEFVRLPEWAQDRGGKLTVQLTDEMREADFFDQVMLVAVEHPADEEVFANEIYAARGKRSPVSAVDDHGHDVLPLLLEQDGRYPADFQLGRIPGMAAKHALTLDLGELPANAPASLWLNGWVFWTDSNGARALVSNNQVQMLPPYLQVRNASGDWVTVVPDMGVPSGTHRTMRVDLTGKFLSADHHVRIVTNLCVYWDQIFFTTEGTELAAPRALVELPMTSADLHYRGFSTPTSDLRHVQPDTFDYEQVMSVAPWNPLRGHYTRYGPVQKLLERPDDELAVMAPGDEMTLEFRTSSLPSLKAGWKRSYFLYVRGYAKDGEPNTSFAWTVAPLPFGGMSNYPPSPADHAPDSAEYQNYLREYQTRPSYALIPPLAPSVH